MAGEAHETAAVGEHADEAAEEAEVAEGVDLPLHAFFLIDEPPATAELDFAGRGAVGVVACHSAEDVVGGGIDVVEDGFRQVVLGFEAVEEAGERLGLRPVADAVASDIRTDLAGEAAVVVTHGAEVELHGPAFGGIEAADVQHDVAGELVLLLRSGGGATAGFLEDAFGLGIADEVGVAVVQTVIAEATADAVEEVVTLRERFEQRGVVFHVEAAGGAEFVAPGVPGLGCMHGEGFVGTEGGIDTDFKTIGGALLMMREVVDRIVGGAEGADLEFFQDAAGAHVLLREHGLGLFPDGGSGLLVEEFVDAEVAFQLDVSPVVERVAQGLRHGFGPGEEFIARGCAAGDVALRDAVAAHGAPFVVVAFEPDFEEIGELAVLGDVLRR